MFVASMPTESRFAFRERKRILCRSDFALVYGGGARVIHSGDGSGSIVGTGALIGGICILGAAI